VQQTYSSGIVANVLLRGPSFVEVSWGNHSSKVACGLGLMV
jgi:hypothetical protein